MSRRTLNYPVITNIYTCAKRLEIDTIYALCPECDKLVEMDQLQLTASRAGFQLFAQPPKITAEPLFECSCGIGFSTGPGLP